MKGRREKWDTKRWARLRVLVHGEQGGKCAHCPRHVPLVGSLFVRMHLCHIVNLGAGPSRHDPDAHRFVEGRKVMLNDRENLVGLCQSCHDVLDGRF